MRRLAFIFLFICIGLSASAQMLSKDDITIKDNSFSYIYQTDVPLTKLFGKVNQWVAKSFNDYKSVIQYEDKENYRLIMKGILLLDGTWVDNLSISLTFDCKDGKYRVLSDGMVITINGKDYTYEQYMNATVENVFGVAPVDAAIIAELESQRDIAQAKFDKAKNKWQPRQFHYEKPKAELEKIEKRIRAVKQYNKKAELFLQTRESDIKSKIADLYNNISSFISTDDDF